FQLCCILLQLALRRLAVGDVPHDGDGLVPEERQHAAFIELAALPTVGRVFDDLKRVGSPDSRGGFDQEACRIGRKLIPQALSWEYFRPEKSILGVPALAVNHRALSIVSKEQVGE